MKGVHIAVLLSLAPLLGQEQGRQDPEVVNVNERYTIESAEVSGVEPAHLSRSIREDVRSLAGRKFSQEKLDEVSKVIARALPGRTVSVRVSRGERPESVKVVFEVKQHEQRFDLSGPKGMYHSRQGWTGELDASVKVRSNTFTFGVLSDGDALLERYAGVRARYVNRHPGTGRLRAAFEFDSYHNIWNPSTLQVVDGTHQLYRTRQNFEPELTIILDRSLALTAGFSFQRFQSQFSAAHTEASNAVVTTLRYDRLLEGPGSSQHRVEAGYSLRAATSSLASDYEYTRHSAEFRYSLYRGPHHVETHLTAGVLSGDAPLFDRFVLGNSTTLRGWNKYEIAPAGGNRAVHNSVEYRYRAFEVFYDAGSVWSSGQRAVVRHSAGTALRFGDFALLIAFPIRNGRAEPVFMAGLNL